MKPVDGTTSVFAEGKTRQLLATLVMFDEFADASSDIIALSTFE